jgi:MoxR-like ATPase
MAENNQTTREEVEKFARLTKRLRDEIQKMIVGHTEVVDGVITSLLAGGHTLLEGVPGLGKTLLVRTLAGAVDLKFSRIQFTPDLQPKDIIGAEQLDETGKQGRVFVPGPIFANIVLADEVNRATPRTQSALLEAMAEASVTVGRTTHKLESPFFVLATQNPLEMDGTYPLPEAQLDRFLYKLHVQFPSLEELNVIMNRTVSGETPEIQNVMNRAELLELRQIARKVGVSQSIQNYALRVLRNTHPTTDGAPDIVRRFVRQGSSPRGGQAMLAAARIQALMRSETMVSQNDIVQAALPALRHRLILNFEGEAEGVDRDEILRTVLQKTPANLP